jgi:hypothetical protein
MHDSSKHTLTTAVELDGDLLIHILAQVEDILLLRPLAFLLRASCASSTTASASTAGMRSLAAASSV